MFESETNLEIDQMSLEGKQNLLAHHVRLVARKHSPGLFIFGEGGLGKSRTVLRTLEEEGICAVLINSHITPLALYSILYQNRNDAVLFFDDLDSILNSLAHLGILRSALWGQGQRIITYGSSQLPNNLPPNFEFNSRIIFAANVIPRKNPAFSAVLTRCDQYQLEATNSEIVDLMRKISSEGFRGLTPEDCEMVIDYIEEHSSDHQLSMRLLGPSLRKLLYARQELMDWRPLVLTQLQTLGRKQIATKRLDTKSQDIKWLRIAIAKYPENVNEQQEFWRQKTQKSRASFYRCLNRYRDEIGE